MQKNIQSNISEKADKKSSYWTVSNPKSLCNTGHEKQWLTQDVWGQEQQNKKG